jgi:AcrR family transcriptional regulator
MEAFRDAWELEGEQFWRTVFEMHRDKMQIKNPKVAIGNLEKIFKATFSLANSKGFQAMSLRDLSRETGISMGGLYAYIGSKNDLASVIEGVLRHYIDKVVGSLAKENLQPKQRLKAIVYGEIYMMQILNPWYYFCYMELKGLDREQQEQAMELELRFDRILIDAFKAGIELGQFTCEKPELLAASITSQLQQWYLKHWKFKLRNTSMDEYAEYVYQNLLVSLQASGGEQKSTLREVAVNQS